MDCDPLPVLFPKEEEEEFGWSGGLKEALCNTVTALE